MDLLVCPFCGLDPGNQKFPVACLSNTVIMQHIMAKVDTRNSKYLLQLKDDANSTINNCVLF